MKARITSILLFAMLGYSVTSFCQNNTLEFVENKGQWNPAVKYKGDFTTGAFFLTANGFRVVQNNPKDLKYLADMYHGKLLPDDKQGDTATEKKVVVHSHAYDVKFLNANKPAIVPDKPLGSYNNYFIGKNEDQWQGNCRIFQAVTYQSMYNGVDVRYYTNNGQLKYDIIVHPGADADKITMQYNGADGLQVKDNSLVVKTSLGNNIEMPPYAFQIVNGFKKEVICRFKINGNVVHFDLEGYDKSATLVIDPTLIFSTFTGSTEDNWGYTATYGTDGSFYAGGIVFGTGFPVSPGAYQTTYDGGVVEGGIRGYDIGIIKFNPTGTNRVYATYIGGSGNEQPHSLVADAQGNLIIAGRTNSTDFPLKNGSLFGTGGGYDIILTKLNATGTNIIGSRRIGGTDNDGANIGPKYVNPQGEISIRRNYGDDARSEVILDGSGNILLATNTRSTNFPLASAFQSNIGGAQDGVIIKASPNLSTIMVSSFLGGNGDDAAFVLARNPVNNNIYVGGNTTSTNLPGNTTGVLHPSFSGNTDGFVSILSPSAATLLKTGYFGTPGFDMLYGIQFDKSGFPYIMGTSTNNWPIQNALFSEPGGKQFISKLLPDLSGYIYSTVFGTDTILPNISPIAFLVDKCDNVYVSGWGGNVNTQTGFQSSGTNGLAVTSNALQKTTDGSDFYFFVLERNAKSRLYSSFFGQFGGVGEHVDGGTSRFDRDGIIYQALCANCGNNVSFPTTPGAWATQNGARNCNLAAVKIAFNLSGLETAIKSSIQGSTNDRVGCLPLKVFFQDTLAEGVKYEWIYGDGSPKQTTLLPSVTHTFTDTGLFYVMLISIDSSKCNITDTSRTTIRVKTFKAFVDFDWQKLAECDSSKTYIFNNLSTVNPSSKIFGPTSFVWDFGDGSPPLFAGLNSVSHSFPGNGTYLIKLTLRDTDFCNAPLDTMKRLRISDIVRAGVQTDYSGCAPYYASFANTTIAGNTYLWNFGDGDTSTLENPIHLYTVPNTYTITLIAQNLLTCNKRDTIIIQVTVKVSPKARMNFSPNPPQVNTPVDFFNTSINADWFLWKYGDGDSLAINNTNSVQHSYNYTRLFSACLYAFNKNGCRDTVCTPIAARVLPLLDVPNAFTPNNDGYNDKVYVRGFGILSMLWRIYNRWGTMIYESIDKNQGWDGRYKGALQPMEVYHYTLDVIYSDNNTFQKQGDITLIR